jgi:hypothetical protein
LHFFVDKAVRTIEMTAAGWESKRLNKIPMRRTAPLSGLHVIGDDDFFDQ